MRKKMGALIRLTRHQEYFCFVIVTTLLGASSADGTFGWQMMGVLLANWLVVAFAFMINDVEDAPDDALNPAKMLRNPVSARALSPRLAGGASYFVGFISLLVYLPLGVYPFSIGAICLITSFLYSWRGVRLKTIPVLDMVSHSLMLAGFQFLAAYFTFDPGPLSRWLFPFLFLVAFSMYGVLFNQLRDLEWDLQAGVTHTTSVLGPRLAYRLMMSLLSLGIISALVTVFVIHLIPTWVLLLLICLSLILSWPPLLKARQKKSSIDLQHSFQKPLEIAAASALLIQFIGTWAVSGFWSRLF
jgi:4-hydroxybenzoate polyprenyltransferase